MNKKVKINESNISKLIRESILCEENISDILKSRDLEKKIKEVTIDSIKNNSQLEKELEKKVRKITAKAINNFFKVLWQRKYFYEGEL